MAASEDQARPDTYVLSNTPINIQKSGAPYPEDLRFAPNPIAECPLI